MAISVLENNHNLSLTDRRWFSLVTRYPELPFDPEDRFSAKGQDRPPKVPPKDPPKNLNISPISVVTDDGDRSRLSNSTAQTTPLRPLQLVPHQSSPRADTVAGFLRQVRYTDLPEECRLCFTSLGQSVGAISAGLVPSTNGRYRINNTYFMDQCSVLLRELQTLSTRTKDQLKQIAHLKSLVIFNTNPTDDMLWSMYRQRALLIVRLTAIPSASELRLINDLALLYHAAVYQPVQLLYDDDEIEPLTMRIINKHYDLLFSWLADYRQWCNAMKELKQQYMTPLVERILSSRAVCADVANLQDVQEKGEVALANPTGPRMLPLDEWQLKALNLSVRRKRGPLPGPGGSMRQKTRFRRQKTI